MGVREDLKDYLERTAKAVDERIEKYIPRSFGESSLIFRLNPPPYRLDFEALNKAISEPLWDFLDRGGKRWRQEKDHVGAVQQDLRLLREGHGQPLPGASHGFGVA
ncbi:hypothetical protein B6U84_05175 [Candidatus Bathyarchaeota archaeon ex4484_40]|nr:MAG: hypothetical protein B6U84_05175 [Candidatus Bathyarchaeota archaeon ex4484_40]